MTRVGVAARCVNFLEDRSIAPYRQTGPAVLFRDQGCEGPAMLPCLGLDSDQVAALAEMRELIDAAETCFVAKAEKRLLAPFAGPQPMFTIGGINDANGSGLAGLASTRLRLGSARRTASLPRCGALRAGAIGRLALRDVAPITARTLGVIGTGRQAETHLMAVQSTLIHIDVFGRNAANRAAFAARLEERFEEVVICPTTSEQIDTAWPAPAGDQDDHRFAGSGAVISTWLLP